MTRYTPFREAMRISTSLKDSMEDSWEFSPRSLDTLYSFHGLDQWL